MVKTVPLIANIINAGGPTGKTVYTLPDGVSLNEHMEPSFVFVHLNEATAAVGDVSGMFDDIVEMMSASGFSKGKVYKSYKSA